MAPNKFSEYKRSEILDNNDIEPFSFLINNIIFVVLLELFLILF